MTLFTFFCCVFALLEVDLVSSCQICNSLSPEATSQEQSSYNGEYSYTGNTGYY